MAEHFYYRRLALHRLVFKSIPNSPDYAQLNNQDFSEVSDAILYRIDLAIKKDIESRANWRTLNRGSWPPVEWPS